MICARASARCSSRTRSRTPTRPAGNCCSGGSAIPTSDADGVADLQQVITESGARDAVESMISEGYERALKALHDVDMTDEGRAGLTSLADAAVRREA